MIKNIFNDLHKNKILINTSSLSERKEKIKSIKNWIINNRPKIKKAIWNDFKKPFEETDLTEVYPLISECNHTIKHLSKWLKKKRVKKTLSLITTSGYIKYEAKGIVLIISPWNYPFQLAIGPLISAIAAGNCVVIKPSEISKNTSQLIEEMINNLFPQNEVAVIKGNADIAEKLLELPFDHIFFTGSTNVGKIVMKAASKNLTSVTLELGGKSPIIIDKTANLKMAAEKIVWGKFLNSGQTCIAPDYVLVNKKNRNEFTDFLVTYIQKLYGTKDLQSNSDYANIISKQHHQRLLKMLDDSIQYNNRILLGEDSNNFENFIAPTLILSDKKKSKINSEEIFGPILPIVEYDNLDEAITWINNKTPPLSIYIFSNSKINIEKIAKLTKSGGIVINEVMLQFTHPNLPFGGVRESGIGRSHGFAGFKEFSIERSYLKAGKINPLKLFYPPFNEQKRKLIDLLIKYF
jgi:aldehyde dehydrogenase (NAD+)